MFTRVNRGIRRIWAGLLAGVACAAGGDALAQPGIPLPPIAKPAPPEKDGGPPHPADLPAPEPRAKPMPQRPTDLPPAAGPAAPLPAPPPTVPTPQTPPPVVPPQTPVVPPSVIPPQLPPVFMPSQPVGPHARQAQPPCDRVPFVPNMLGDFIGGFSFKPAPPLNLQPRAVANGVTRFKVADNNSPAARTRALYSYNYFNDAFGTGGDLHRNFLGGEFAFLDNLVSVQAKFSIDTFTGYPVADQTELSDFHTTFKFVLLTSPEGLLSAGLDVGWPTASLPGKLDDTNVILSPFVGAFWRPEGSQFFVQGFEQLDIPTASGAKLLLHTDIGVGYLILPEDARWLTLIAPTVELHAYTPIGDASGVYKDLGYRDVWNMTTGVTLGLGDNATVALGMAFPLSDQQDYDWEFQLHLNWFFGASAR